MTASISRHAGVTRYFYVRLIQTQPDFKARAVS